MKKTSKDNLVEKLFKTYNIKKRYCGFLDFGDLDSRFEFCSFDTLQEWRDACSSSNNGSNWIKTGDGDDDVKEVFQKPLRKYPELTGTKLFKLICFLILHDVHIYRDGDEIEISAAQGYYLVRGINIKEALIKLLIDYPSFCTVGDFTAIKNILTNKELEGN